MKLKYLIRLATVVTACNSLTTEAVSVEDASCGISTSASLGREKNNGTGQRIKYSGLRATISSAREKNCKCTLDMLRTKYCLHLTCFTIILLYLLVME